MIWPGKQIYFSANHPSPSTTPLQPKHHMYCVSFDLSKLLAISSNVAIDMHRFARYLNMAIPIFEGFFN